METPQAIKGYLTFGPKDNYMWRIELSYIPTPEQIKNLQDYFGFDFILVPQYDTGREDAGDGLH